MLRHEYPGEEEVESKPNTVNEKPHPKGNRVAGIRYQIEKHNTAITRVDAIVVRRFLVRGGVRTCWRTHLMSAQHGGSECAATSA